MSLFTKQATRLCPRSPGLGPCVFRAGLPPAPAPLFLWRTFSVEDIGSGRQVSLPSCMNAFVGSPQACLDGTEGLEVCDPAGDRCVKKLRRSEPGTPTRPPLPFRHPCHAEFPNPLIHSPCHSLLSGAPVPSSNASRSWQIVSAAMRQRTHRLHKD